MEKGKLFVIATPIGNLEDVTLRALRMFRELPVWFAEDTREFKKLLNCLEIPLEGKTVHSMGKHNLPEATGKALQFLQAGKSLGLVTDRGTPCISDPGFQLVARARELQIEIIPLPGPSAVVLALSASGLPSDRFLFLGFLPDSATAQEELMKKMEQANLTTVFFESPKRISTTLSLLKTRFPQGKIVLAREMTKLHEEFQAFQLSDWNGAELSNKGEYTIVVEPHVIPSSPEPLEREIELRLASEKEWARQIAEKYQLSSRDIYNLLQESKRLTR